MKCDELQYERLGDANKTYPASTLVIRKQFVDAAIAELKDENRSLKRALWLARAKRAHAEQHWGAYVEYVHRHERSFYGFDGDDILRRDNKNNDSFREWHRRWAYVEYKCKSKGRSTNEKFTQVCLRIRLAFSPRRTFWLEKYLLG